MVSDTWLDFGIFIRMEDINEEMLRNRLFRHLNEFSISEARPIF